MLVEGRSSLLLVAGAVASLVAGAVASLTAGAVASLAAGAVAPLAAELLLLGRLAGPADREGECAL